MNKLQISVFIAFSKSVPTFMQMGFVYVCRECRHGQEVQLLFRPNSRIGKKFNLSDFDCGIIAGSRWGGLSISETVDLLCFVGEQSL